MKEKLRKKLPLFLIILSLILPTTVFASAQDFGVFIVDGLAKLFSGIGISQSGITDGNFEFTDYDPRLSLFDYHEASLPLCDINYNIENSLGSWSCIKGTQPNLKTLVDVLPYIVRVTYHINNYDYYVFLFYDKEDYDSLINKTDLVNGVHTGNYTYYLKSPEFIISYLPKTVGSYENEEQKEWSNIFWSSIMTTLDNGCLYYDFNTLLNIRSTCYQYDDFDSYKAYISSYSVKLKLNNLTSAYTMSIDANFEINYDSINYIYGPDFKTDSEISIPPNYYVLLVPKKNDNFSTYIYTDNVFSYSIDFYNESTETYSYIDRGALTDLNLGAMGKYPWLTWEFNFTKNEIDLKKVVRIFNTSSSNNLKLKFFSSDFNVRLMSSSSSSFCVGDSCFSNDYDDLYSFSHSFNYNVIYDNDDYNNGLSFIKDIPNMIKDFVNSFTFIGTLFTSFFTIFTGSISNYFYIIFGLMIIMIIIKILK